MIRHFTLLAAAGLLLMHCNAQAAEACDAAAPALLNSKPVIQLETNMGSIQVQLDAVRAPLTVDNFLRYVASGYYDETLFHRVIPGFVVQGGGFSANYEQKTPCNPVVNEAGNGLTNSRGTIAMARMAEPHSANSQFYFNLANNAQLDPNSERWGYAVFGQVIEGIEVLDTIAEAQTGSLPALQGQRDVPLTPVVLIKATVIGGIAPESTEDAADQ